MSLSHRRLGMLLWPLQLLKGNALLAALLATIAKLASPIGRPTPTTPNPTMMETPTSPPGSKWCCCLSNQEAASLRSGQDEVAVLDVTPEEQPHQKQKDRRPLRRLLKESCWEAFSKDTEIIKAARQAYHPFHRGMFIQEGSYDMCMCHIQQPLIITANYCND